MCLWPVQGQAVVCEDALAPALAAQEAQEVMAKPVPIAPQPDLLSTGGTELSLFDLQKTPSQPGSAGQAVPLLALKLAAEQGR